MELRGGAPSSTILSVKAAETRQAPCYNLTPIHTSFVIKWAREHNLKNIDVTIPRDQLFAITAWMGQGRRSLPE